MKIINKIFAPLSLMAGDYLSYFSKEDKSVSQDSDVQTPESRDWYLRKAEEKRKRKAEKLKKMFEADND